MRDQPAGADLLQPALEVFRDRLLPALPRELRYEALMVANAIAVVARQVAAGERPLQDARQRLGALYAGDALADMEQRLATDIRAGRFDPGASGRAAIFDHLWKTTRANAAESAPKALTGRHQ